MRDQAKIAIKLKDEVSKRDSVITLYQQKTVITNSRINDLQSSVLLLENTQKNKDYLYLQEIERLKKSGRPKRFGIGGGLGYGVGPDLKPRPFIGAVASYNIIRL